MKKLIIIVSLLVISVSVDAKTEVKVELDKLKQNTENSEHNYKQYQTNLDIVDRNIKQADSAAKELTKLKTQLNKNAQNVDKNKAALTKLETDVKALKTKEIARISKDEQQIQELKRVLDKLETNKRNRELNVQAYDKKLAEINKERGEWDQQMSQMATLQKQIDAKKKVALDEKAKWNKKRADYSSEAKKWNKEHKKAEATYNKYSRLAN
jgi:chromosome segregation ATPase